MLAPFGFVVGDIIAVINLISQITNALHETSEALANFQALQSGLKSLSQSLETANAIVHTLSYDCTRIEISSGPAPLNGLAEFNFCKRLLGDLRRGVSGLHDICQLGKTHIVCGLLQQRLHGH